VGSIKAMVRSVHAGRVRDFILPLVQSRDHSLRDKLKDFARDHHTAIDDVAVSVQGLL
jgi:phosphotransferase system enzyme I (PtsP)